MAPKKPNPMEDPPAASSSEEEEESSSSEEGEEGDSSSSSEEEDQSPPKPKPKLSSPPPPPPPPAKQKKQQQQPPKNPETLSSSSTSESDSEDDSESESESEKTLPSSTVSLPDPTVKPIATKPMEETPKTTKPRSKLASTPIKSTAAKRSIENDFDSKDSKDSKKVKTGSDDVGGIEEKKLFQRIWSEEDEIAVLKGMLEYFAKEGVDPTTDMNGFLDYIKNALHFDVTKVQLHDKIKRLKKKYENNLNKGKKGEDPSFTKDHEQKSYNLSKKIWGGEGVESSAPSASKLNGKTTSKKSQTPKANGKPNGKVVASPEVKKMDIDGNESETLSVGEMAVCGAGVDEYVLKRGLELVDGGKRVELEKRWRKLHLAQLELFVERSELIFDQAKLVLEAAKSLKH